MGALKGRGKEGREEEEREGREEVAGRAGGKGREEEEGNEKEKGAVLKSQESSLATQRASPWASLVGSLSQRSS